MIALMPPAEESTISPGGMRRNGKRGKTPGTQVQHARGVADEIAEIRGRYGVQ